MNPLQRVRLYLILLHRELARMDAWVRFLLRPADLHLLPTPGGLRIFES